MNRFARFLPLLWLMSFGNAQAACEAKVEPVTLPKPAPPATDSLIRNVVLDPPAGAPLGKDTVLTVDFEYRIAGFTPGDFRLAPLFKSGVNRTRTIDFGGKDSSVALNYESAKVRLCLPLAQIYGADAERVIWPLELNLAILKAAERGNSRMVAGTKPLKLNTLDMPAAALARQRAAPPPEYEDALDFTYNHFLQRSVLYKVCLERVPALQPRYTPAYRRWEARHKADIDYVSGLKFEALKQQSNGRADVATNILDSIAEGPQQAYASFNPTQMQEACERILERQNPDEDDTVDVVGDYLAVLRKWDARK